MRKHPWFWGALFFWCLLGVAGTLWAVWWGGIPPQGVKEIARGGVQWDGKTVEWRRLEGNGGPRESADNLARDWAADGWVPLDGGRNLAPDVLAILPEDPEGRDALNDALVLRVFRKRGVCRLLALLRGDSNGTGALSADVPDETVTAPDMDAPPGAVSRSLAVPGVDYRLFTWAGGGDAEGAVRRWAGSKGWFFAEGYRRGADRLLKARRGNQTAFVSILDMPYGATVTWLQFK